VFGMSRKISLGRILPSDSRLLLLCFIETDLLAAAAARYYP